MNNRETNFSKSLRFYSDISLKVSEPTQEAIMEAKSVLLELANVSVSELIPLLKSQENITYTSASIPQFSSLDDCFNAIDRLVRSGLDGVPFAKMGFFLRTSQHKKGADCKYGENHIKCAELMGLCRIDKGVWKTPISYAYEQLDDALKLSLRPKLCLAIPIVREYFVQGENDDYLLNALACLSESTRKRRMPNMRTLIATVKSEMS